MDNKPAGYYWPVHRSMIDPMLMAGIDRSFCFLIWMFAFCIGIIMKMYWFFIPATILHMIVRKCTNEDPLFFLIFKAQLQTKSYFW